MFDCLNIFIVITCSFAATLFFALIMKCTRKTIFYSAITGAIAYLVYYIIASKGYNTSAFFLGTFVATIICELLARKFYKPATIFIFPAIITIVPGLGLYETMSYLVNSDISTGSLIGAKTILYIIIMAISMSVASVLFLIFKDKNKRVLKKNDDPLSSSNKEVLYLIGMAGRIILENGGETYRAEDICKYICYAYGIEHVESIALPIGIFITVGDIDSGETTLIKRIKKRSINLDKLDKLNNLSRKISSGNMEIKDAIKEIKEIDKTSNDGKYKWLKFSYEGLSAGFFSLLFFGGFYEFICAFIAGLLVTLVTEKMIKIESHPFFLALIGGIIISSVAFLFQLMPIEIDSKIAIISGMMPLLPGLAMTNAIQDAMRGDLVSGLARGAEAIIIATSLAIGVGMILSISSYFNMMIL